MIINLLFIDCWINCHLWTGDYAIRGKILERIYVSELYTTFIIWNVLEKQINLWNNVVLHLFHIKYNQNHTLSSFYNTFKHWTLIRWSDHKKIAFLLMLKYKKWWFAELYHGHSSLKTPWCDINIALCGYEIMCSPDK